MYLQLDLKPETPQLFCNLFPVLYVCSLSNIAIRKLGCNDSKLNCVSDTAARPKTCCYKNRPTFPQARQWALDCLLDGRSFSERRKRNPSTLSISNYCVQKQSRRCNGGIAQLFHVRQSKRLRKHRAESRKIMLANLSSYVTFETRGQEYLF